MYPYNRNTQLYHSRAKETQAEKPSLLAQDKRLEELLSLARTEATETTRKFETLLDRAELSEAGQILRTMYLDGKKHLRLLQEVGFLIFGTTPQEMSSQINIFPLSASPASTSAGSFPARTQASAKRSRCRRQRAVRSSASPSQVKISASRRAYFVCAYAVFP